MPCRIACFVAALLLAASVPNLRASATPPRLILAAWGAPQDDGNDLTPDEVQQIRDNAIYPNERIKLYIKFIGQRLDEIKQLAPNATTGNNRAQIRDKFEEFTHLCDELQDNLETYDSAHADIRKALKELVTASGKWDGALKIAPDDPAYNFSRTTALEAAQSASDEARQMAGEQDVFFQAHKNWRHKNGTAPN